MIKQSLFILSITLLSSMNAGQLTGNVMYYGTKALGYGAVGAAGIAGAAISAPVAIPVGTFVAVETGLGVAAKKMGSVPVITKNVDAAANKAYSFGTSCKFLP